MNGHIVYASKFSTDIKAFEKIATNENLSKTDIRVFIFLCGRIGSRHLTKIDKSQIAETLNVSKKKITESIDNLCRECILTQDGDDHVKSGYKMAYVIDDDDD